MTAIISARDFSYTSADDAPWRQTVIRGIEHVTGKPRLRKLYEEYCRGPGAADFFAEAVARLNLKVQTGESDVSCVPPTGPLVVVANHPFGVVDGIVLGYLVSRARTDFRILVHSVLYRLPELRPHLLPIDFSETPQALRTNLDSRRIALDDLCAGRAIAIFPGGAVSTARLPVGRAMDPEWKPFVARLIREGQATVLPVYFDGQNSRLFQIASHVSMTLRTSLLFREVVNKMGSEVRVRIGTPIPYADLSRFDDRRTLVEYLRGVTYALGAPPQTSGGRFRRALRTAVAGNEPAA